MSAEQKPDIQRKVTAKDIVSTIAAIFILVVGSLVVSVFQSKEKGPWDKPATLHSHLD
jgi:hypothetical protein